MINDSPQSSSKQVTPTSSPSSEQLLQDLMSQQEQKNPDLAAKQARLIQILKENTSSETPSA